MFYSRDFWFVHVLCRRQGIGRNEQHNIAGENAVSYKGLSLASSVYRDRVSWHASVGML